MMIEANGIWPKKSIGSKPRLVAMRPKIPFTGFMNMFFQTSADTVGITKNGAMTMMRMIPVPNIGLSSRIAAKSPPIVVMANTPPTNTRVFLIAAVKLGSVTNQ